MRKLLGLDQPFRRSFQTSLVKLVLLLMVGSWPVQLRAQFDSSYAQKTVPVPSNGLYRLAIDFLAARLSYGFADGQPHYHLRPHPPIWGRAKLVTPDTLIRTGSFLYWGCRFQGKDYRFYRGESYEVIDHEGIVVYSKLYFGTEGFIFEEYYFSLTAKDPIRPLNRTELLGVFVQNPAMIQLIRGVRKPFNWIRPVPPHHRPFVLELYLNSLNQAVQTTPLIDSIPLKLIKQPN
jgi:hypothetical protein